MRLRYYYYYYYLITHHVKRNMLEKINLYHSFRYVQSQIVLKCGRNLTGHFSEAWVPIFHSKCFKVLRCFKRHLETDPRHPIIIGTITTRTFDILCSSILKSVYLSFSFAFAISLLSLGIATSIRKYYYYYYY